MSVPSLVAIADTFNSAVLRLRAYRDNPDLQQLAETLSTATDHLIRHANTKPIPAQELLCVGCYIEHHAGQRAPEDINHAILNVGGNSTCREHVQIGPAPQLQLPDRTQGGIIIPAGPINGGH